MCAALKVGDRVPIFPSEKKKLQLRLLVGKPVGHVQLGAEV